MFSYDELRILVALAWVGFCGCALLALHYDAKKEYWKERANLWREIAIEEMGVEDDGQSYFDEIISEQPQDHQPCSECRECGEWIAAGFKHYHWTDWNRKSTG